LGENYVAALSLAPTTPEWLSAIRAKPINLGLDCLDIAALIY
jgi:preprotein translocase subunit SecD